MTLTRQQIDALSLVVKGNSTEQDRSIAKQALLLLSKCPIWANCTVDATTLATIMRDLTRFFDGDSTLNPDEPHYLVCLAIEATEYFQAQYTASPPTAEALTAFINRLTNALDHEGDWINTEYHITNMGQQRLTHLLRRHN